VGRDISESADVEFFRHSRMFNNSQNQIQPSDKQGFRLSDAMTWKQIRWVVRTLISKPSMSFGSQIAV
jgi:hypothetical protein